ncbi:hypothetical protein PR048_007763 [Dryococelus australis]|uniref:Uncharacterized protein n=1 Tax=Dryococelus australis TaxID=614101 RepID=A0ABQ9HW17_9NEOP|nr:hypothetical protein PR048_007763 [Dryococelus australis]
MFLANGSVNRQSGSDREHISDETVDEIRAAIREVHQSQFTECCTYDFVCMRAQCKLCRRCNHMICNNKKNLLISTLFTSGVPETLRVFKNISRAAKYGNEWYVLMKDIIIGQIKIVTGDVYLDMLEQFADPQCLPLQTNVTFQLESVPPRWNLHVREFLDSTFPQ